MRGRWVVSTALVALGAVLALLGSPKSRGFIAPGPLTAAHSSLASQQGCAACHAADSMNLRGWVGKSLAWGGGYPSQPGLCLKCHEKLIDPQFVLAAHTAPIALRDRQPALASSGLASTSLAGDARPACSACHREHHGPGHDLTFITSGRCQACHQQRYSGLSDHPNFSGWPTKRRTAIQFNHASHQSKHHPTKQRPFQCADCHADSPQGGFKQTLPYETGCASCHDETIRTTSLAGVPLLELPMLDTEALAEAGHPIEGWPDAAAGDFDGELPALMQLLLSADPDCAAALQRLGHDSSFYDIDPEDPTQLADAATLARGTQTLLREMGTQGQPALERRLALLLPAGTPLAPLVAHLPAQQLGEQAAQWAQGETTTDGPLANAGWRIESQSLSLRYVPAGHADPWMRAWLDALAALPDPLRGLREAALRSWAGPTSPGQCATCHSLELVAGRREFRWRATDPTTRGRAFTRFSHTPHLTQSELRDCTHCHVIEPTADTSAGYAGLDPAVFVSEFRPLDKGACISCHQPKLAGDSCTQCHNYHVDTAAAEAFTRSLAPSVKP